MSRLTSLAGALAILSALAAAAPAAAQETAMVPTRVIYPGETVLDAVNQVPLARGKQLNGSYARDPGQLDGKVARRTLLPGRLIPLNAVRQAYLVEQGAPVLVMFVQGGLVISTKAIALQPGSAGDMVRVRNADSGVMFNGIVMTDGTIRVGAT